MTWLACFAFAVAQDFVATHWTQAVVERRPIACFYSVVCSLLAFGWVYLCAHDLYALLPTAVGHALGTWLAMRWARKS